MAGARVYGSFRVSDEHDVHFLTLPAHFLGPDACLDFADMCLLEIVHAKARLPYAASDAQRQRAFQQTVVEVQLFAVFLAGFLELVQKRRPVDTYAHR